MKLMYRFMIFLALFQVVVVLVNSLGVFPDDSTLYSDVEMEEIESQDGDILGILSYIFLPQGEFKILGISVTITSFSIAAIISIIAVSGAAVSIVTHSFIPVVLALFSILFLPMFTRSIGFFRRVFEIGDSPSLMYLGVVLLVGIMIVFVLTVVEMPTHGRSG